MIGVYSIYSFVFMRSAMLGYRDSWLSDFTAVGELGGLVIKRLGAAA